MPKHLIKKYIKKSLIISSIMGISMCAISQALAYPISLAFASGDESLLNLTEIGFRIYAVAFTFFGINIFTTSLFTSLNNGLISAILSITRTLIYPITFVYLLPLIWGLNGIWISIICAELFTLPFSILFIVLKRKKYNY